MNKNKELFKNTIIISAGRFTTQFISFILLPIYTFNLSPNEYGEVDIILAYTLLLAPLLTIQLEMASFRFLIDARGDKEKISNIISSTLTIVFKMLFVCLIGSIIITRFVNMPYAFILSLNILFTIITNVFLQFARGLGDNKKYAIGSTITGLFTLISSLICLIVFNLGISGVIASIIIANIACMIYLYFGLNIKQFIDFKINNPKIRSELIRYSLPLVISSLSWWIINVSDRTIITLTLGATANGIYAVANKYAAIYIAIFFVFFMFCSESTALHIKSKDRTVFFSSSLNSAIKFFSALGIILIAIYPIFSAFLISTEFKEASQYEPVLIMAAYFSSINGMYSAIYLALKKSAHVAKTTLYAAIFNVIVTVCLVQYIGVMGAAIATTLSFVLLTLLRFFDIKNYVTLKHDTKLFIKILIAYVISIVLFYQYSTIGNISNIIFAGLFFIYLNSSLIKTLFNTARTRINRKKFTS